MSTTKVTKEDMGLGEYVNRLPGGHLARMELEALRSVANTVSREGNREDDYGGVLPGPPLGFGGGPVGIGATINQMRADMKRREHRNNLIHVASRVLPVLLGVGDDCPWPDADDVAKDAISYAEVLLAHINGKEPK